MQASKLLCKWPLSAWLGALFFSEHLFHALRGRIIRKKVARQGCAVRGKGDLQKNSTMPSRIWSLAEQFARNLQFSGTVWVGLYVRGICTCKFLNFSTRNLFCPSVVQLGLFNITINYISSNRILLMGQQSVLLNRKFYLMNSFV